MGLPIKFKKQKKQGKCKPPGPLKTNWLDDDFYETGSMEYSYARCMARYYVIHKVTGEITEFRKKKRAEEYALGRNSWVHSFEPTEEEAHLLRQKEKAEQRWEAGYGA